MDACSDPAIDEVVGMFASQTGKTDCVLNIVGFHIQHDPSPMLIVQPTLEMAEAWSKDRLAPMLRDSPSLRGRIADAKSKSSGQTIRHKTFAGGHLTASGSNSPSSLAGRPIRILLMDEIDRMAASAGPEGSPIKLASTRTHAFWNRKRVYISSPGNKGSSMIEPLWERSDKRRFFVPCPDCAEYQFLKWPQVTWQKDEHGEHRPETAGYACEHCGSLWNDAQRAAAVRRGEWRATAPFRGCAGFHVSALYAPWDAMRLEHLVTYWLEAQGNPELLKVFVNTVLAELWEEKYHGLDDSVVAERLEDYPERDGVMLAPTPVAVIVAGVDVQDDRIEVQIQGYGRGSEKWLLSYHVLDGDPSGTAVWEALGELLLQPIPMQRGGVDYIRATCVDTGAHTLKAYDFCRPRYRYMTADRRLAYVFPIKGQGGAGGEFWPRAPSRNTKGRLPVYMVRVDHAKELIYTSLKRIHEAGPGYMHFPTNSPGQPFDARYAAQLTAEKVSDKASPNGSVERVWELKAAGRRNEALDVSVYGEAAMRGLFSLGLDLDLECERAAKLAAAGGSGSGTPGTPPSAPSQRKGRRRSTSSYLERED